MRWTLDGVEFFRYVEKEEPAARSFPISGIQVDVNNKPTRELFYSHYHPLKIPPPPEIDAQI